MKVRTSELTGAALDWAVATLQNVELDEHECGIWFSDQNVQVHYSPSTNWAQGGPVIEREHISVEPFKSGPKWCAFKFDTGDCEIAADAPLIAAMRCYVASKLGDEVEIPEVQHKDVAEYVSVAFDGCAGMDPVDEHIAIEGMD